MSRPRRSWKPEGSLRSSACRTTYNLAHRTDDALIDDLAGDGIAYVPFFPLGGFTPLQSATLSDVAARLEATPMQVALAWLLQRSPNILVIPGTSSIAHLRENFTAAEIALPGSCGQGAGPRGNTPGDARELVGERDRKHIVV